MVTSTGDSITQAVLSNDLQRDQQHNKQPDPQQNKDKPDLGEVEDERVCFVCFTPVFSDWCPPVRLAGCHCPHPPLHEACGYDWVRDSRPSN